MKPPVRRAVLIASQSAGEFLLGVNADIERQRDFLLSPLGGAWRTDEITMLRNPSRIEVLNAIDKINADYLYCYFAGHGMAKSQTERYLAVNDGLLNDKQLLNFNCTRQLLIADCCRTRPSSGGAIGAIPWQTEQWLNATGESWARQTFDVGINRSPRGHVILHAALDQQSALESDHIAGGEFSLSWVESIQDWQQSGQEGFLSLHGVLYQTTLALQQKQVNQIPECVYHHGSFQVPIALISPRFKKPPRHSVGAANAYHTSSNELLKAAAVGILGWIIYNSFE